MVDQRVKLSAPVRHRLEGHEQTLSPFASRSASSKGRDVSEEPSHLRTEYQRDRDRIIHCKSFRRLKHKTQVFIAPLGDHYVTRLTHTLEVSQIARTIARALNLNEDLAEATALGHDMGHTPFGHIGESELDKLHPEGFRHAEQSLRIVEQLENEGQGLNLTWEVRQGIVSHSKPRGDFLDPDATEGLTLEAQIVRVSDAVAYLNHDFADAFRAGILNENMLPDEVQEVLGCSHGERVDSMVTDIVESSWGATGEGDSSSANSIITMSPVVKHAVITLREFMFENVYVPEDKGSEGKAARQIFQMLYHHYDKHRDEIPPEYDNRSKSDDRVVADYISGMTDHYALRAAEAIRPGTAEVFSSRHL